MEHLPKLEVLTPAQPLPNLEGNGAGGVEEWRK